MTRRAKEKRASRIAEKIENKMEASWIKDAKAQWEELRHEVISGESTDTETSCDDPSTGVIWKSSLQTIAASDQFELLVKCEAHQGVIQWQFQTLEHDVCFSVRVQNDSSANEQDKLLVAPTRYNCAKDPVMATHVISGPCSLFFVWNNDYSWYTPKKVSYVIELKTLQGLDPADDDNESLSSLREKKSSSVGDLQTKAERAIDAMHDRYQAIEEGNQTLTRLSSVISTIDESVGELENSIQMLQDQLDEKKQHQQTAQKEHSSLENQLRIWTWEIQALGWLSLEENSLANVFSFGSPKEQQLSWSCVNHEWHQTWKNQHRSVVGS